MSRLTGLAPQTASSIVTTLEDEDLVVRGEVLRGRRGQPATPLFINRDGAFSVGVEVGWRHIEIVLQNLRLEVIERYHRDYAYPEATTVIGEIQRTVRDFISSLRPEFRSRVVGIGLASPSAIDRGIASLSPPPGQAQLWAGLNLREAVEAATGLSTFWVNDGTAACWIELVVLPHPRPADLTYLHVGTFISAGIIAEHMLWEGKHGNSANLGAMLVHPIGDGRSFEPAHHRASLFALGKKLEAAGRPAPTGNPLDWPWKDFEPVLTEWLCGAAEALALVIANTTAVFEFDCAVIDGTLPKDLVARLVKETREKFESLPSSSLSTPSLVQGTFGREATSRGAAALVVYRRFFARESERLTA